MDAENQFPQRGNPASGVHLDLGQSNIVLLTITTEKRKPWLANETAHQLLRETWTEANAWLVGDYLLMPDHLHCFCAPGNLQIPIESWIKFWKREFAIKTKRLASTLAPPAEWKFQARGWHHRLRNSESHAQKWIYIQENPMRKGLVKQTENWPFKGRIFDLVWSGN